MLAEEFEAVATPTKFKRPNPPRTPRPRSMESISAELETPRSVSRQRREDSVQLNKVISQKEQEIAQLQEELKSLKIANGKLERKAEKYQIQVRELEREREEQDVQVETVRKKGRNKAVDTQSLEGFKVEQEVKVKVEKKDVTPVTPEILELPESINAATQTDLTENFKSPIVSQDHVTDGENIPELIEFALMKKRRFSDSYTPRRAFMHAGNIYYTKDGKHYKTVKLVDFDAMNNYVQLIDGWRRFRIDANTFQRLNK